MPKMNVAFSLDAEELSRFDSWRASLQPPLARGPALVKLFEFMVADGSMLGAHRIRRTMVIDEAALNVDFAPTYEKNEVGAPQVQEAPSDQDY